MNTYDNKAEDEGQNVTGEPKKINRDQNVNTNCNGSEMLKEINEEYNPKIENVEKRTQLNVDTTTLVVKMNDLKITEPNKLSDLESSSLSLNAPKEMNEHVQNNDSQPEEEVFQKVRVILNDFSPKNFNNVVKKIMELEIDTEHKVNRLMSLIFEDAIGESSSVAWYIRLCIEIGSHPPKDTFSTLRSALLDKAEREFNTIIISSKKTQNNRQDNLERKRSVVVARFVGQLFNEQMLSHNILRNCIFTLLDSDSDYKLECLCELLNTTGKKLDVNLKFRWSRLSGRQMLNVVFQKMQKIVDNEVQDYVISKRVLFMLQNVIDLRKKNWNNWLTTPTTKYTKKRQWIYTVRPSRLDRSTENTEKRKTHLQ